MSKLRTLAQIGRTFGLRDGALRLEYEVERGSGLLGRRMRAVAGWDHWSLNRIAPGLSAEDLLSRRREGHIKFFFSDARTIKPRLQEILCAEAQQSIQVTAEQILAGNLPYFDRLRYACGFPPRWYENSATGERLSPDRLWTTMRFASPDYGDLKYILEPSRFLFAYALARAYTLTGDERFPTAFWTAVEDWANNAPPMSGPLWICGQESSLRILAWSFALFAFLNSPATTPQRTSLLTSMIAAHAWRSEQTLGYARSQRSNHLISEAVGLWSAGTLFPELRYSSRWREIGASLLREAALDQTTSDGLHLQYSFNYQRMVTQLLLWVLRLAQIHNVELPAEVHQRTSAALSFLYTIVDPVSGHAPNFGANDGTLLFPLSSCDFGDFRPLLQLGSAVLNHPGLPSGPWDESTVWFGANVSPVPIASDRPTTTPPASSGFHRLGSTETWGLVHASRYERRPFQADQLHLDLWHRGINLACDPGTYLYNGEPPWDNALSRSAVHNTVSIDGQDQMRRAGRFLWVDWSSASGRAFASTDKAISDRFEGEHDGYQRLGVIHHRTVKFLDGGGWVVIDDVRGTGEHEVRLHWLLPDLPMKNVCNDPFAATFVSQDFSTSWNVFSSTPAESTLIRAGKCLPELSGLGDIRTFGWVSPTYGELQPAVSILHRVKSKLPVRFVTIVLVGENLRLESNSGEIIVYCENSELDRVSRATIESVAGEN